VTCGRSLVFPGSSGFRHEIAKILLKVELNTITLTLLLYQFLPNLYTMIVGVVSIDVIYRMTKILMSVTRATSIISKYYTENEGVMVQ
jgi:hypothetical protein